MIFTGSAGYLGHFGPKPGETLAAVGFARAESFDRNKIAAAVADAEAAVGIDTGDLKDIDTGFLCDSYDINWQRPTQIKHFFNNARPAVITGYGQGTVTFTGLIGTFDGLQQITGNQSNLGTSKTTIKPVEEFCRPLVCVIANVNQLEECPDGNGAGGVEHVLYGLVLNTYKITGQIQDNGVLFQQATMVFQVGGVDFAEYNP